MIRSNDPSFTVSAEVLASNLVVMGSVPPVVPLEAAEQAVAHHGVDFANALFDALEALGRRVERPASASLDPRDCDCGKGSACPLMTPALEAALGPAGLAAMDRAAEAQHDSAERFAVIDLVDGMVWVKDGEGLPFLDLADAERFARGRNEGLRAAFQTYRVVRLERVLFADVKPRTGALAE